MIEDRPAPISFVAQYHALGTGAFALGAEMLWKKKDRMFIMRISQLEKLTDSTVRITATFDRELLVVPSDEAEENNRTG